MGIEFQSVRPSKSFCAVRLTFIMTLTFFDALRYTLAVILAG